VVFYFFCKLSLQYIDHSNYCYNCKGQINSGNVGISLEDSIRGARKPTGTLLSV